MKHIEHKCSCYREGCWFCDGGLFACDACGALEGATTSDCLGGKIDEFTWDKIYKGELDFRNGEWVREPNMWRSSYIEKIESAYERITGSVRRSGRNQIGWDELREVIPSMEFEKILRGW